MRYTHPTVRRVRGMCGIRTDQTIPLEALPLRSESVLTLVDGDGVIRYSSSSAERVLEHDQDELVGEHITERVHPDDRPRVSEMVQALTGEQEQADRSVEYRYKKADGTYERVESVGSPQPTDEGLYPIRTSEVTDQEETSADAEARAEFDEFTKVVSHDLRNPLNVAKGRLELVEDTEDLSHLSAIDRALARMDEIIEDLLAITWGGQKLSNEDLEYCDLASLIASCWERVDVPEAGLVADDPPRVRADANRLQRLLENLFRNAIEHGGEDVTLRIGALDDGFFVEDDGPGIPSDQQEEVLKAGYSSDEEGTGLGLSIVKTIVDAHGWSLALTAGRDGGARFEITGAEVDRE